MNKPEDFGICSKRLERINELTSRYVESQEIGGAITLVARRNEIVHLNVTGLMDIENNKPMNLDTIFRIYSMTKPITAVAALILYERGYFQLDTPVSKFIPSIKDMEVLAGGAADDYITTKVEREMNIGDLLKHTSGLTYYFIDRNRTGEIYRKQKVDIFEAHTNHQTLEEYVELIAKTPLLFSPGTAWNYCTGFEVLGRVIEVASGQPLDEFYQKEIFSPLGMIDTGFFVPGNKWHRLAKLYTSLKSPNLHDDQEGLNIYEDHRHKESKLPILLRGGDGLMSTVSDYYNFCKMLLNKGSFGDYQIISPKSVELMTQNHLPGDTASTCFMPVKGFTSEGIGFGFGVSVKLNPAQANIIGSPGEYGWTGGANTIFFIDPLEELIGIFMTQMISPRGTIKIEREFKTAVYQSIIESYI